MTESSLVRVANRVKKELEEFGIKVERIEVKDLSRDVPRHLLLLKHADYALLIKLRIGRSLRDLIVVVEEAEKVKQRDVEQVDSMVERKDLLDFLIENFKVDREVVEIIGIVHGTSGIDKVVAKIASV